MPSKIEIVLCKDAAHLSTFAAAWNKLCWNSPQQLPQLSYAWIATHLEHRVPQDQDWCVIFAIQDGELVGVLPLIAETKRLLFRGRFILRTPLDPHTYVSDCLVLDGMFERVFPLMTQAAIREYPRTLYIELGRVPESSPTIIENGRASGFLRITREHSYGAYLCVPDDFDSYRRSLSKNFRNNLNKARNKLSKLPKVDFQFYRGNPDDDDSFRRFIQVEAASWKGDAGTAIGRSFELQAFYKDLARRLTDAGWLEWQFLKTNNQTLAGNLSIRFREKLIIWKLGYDSQYAQLSPGSLLLEHVIKQNSRDQRGVGEIDFLTNFSWYSKWAARKRKYYKLIYCPIGSISSLSYYALYFVYAIAGALLRRQKNQ